LGNKQQIAKCLINLGVLKFSLKHYDAAVKQFREALLIADALNDLELAATCNNNIGAIYMVQDKLDSSIAYLEEGSKQLNLQDNEIEQADVYNNLANVYIKQKNFKMAETYLEWAKAICNKYDYSEGKMELYQTCSFFYESKEDYKQANKWLKKYYTLKDSLSQIDKEATSVFLENDAPELNRQPNKPIFKNEWILVILSGLLIGIPLLLMRYKR